MTQMLSTLKKSGRAAIVALVLGAATVTSMPAMAQSEPSFSFQLGIGGGSGGNFRFGVDNDHRDRDRCLTNREIRRGLSSFGFRNIDIVRERSRNRVEVIAQFGKRLYLLQVNRCTGQVRIIQRLGRAGFDDGRHDGFDDGPRGGVGLQFNFGN
jgi:hypothetical protein